MARHHLVPKMYLSRFADRQGRLMMISRQRPAERRLVSVNNACNEAGFYSIPTHVVEEQHRDGHDPEAVEKLLAAVESTAAPVLEAMISSLSLPEVGEEARHHVAQLAAFQMTRTWTFRRELAEAMNASAREVVAARATDERVRRFLAQRGKPTRQADVDAFRAQALGPEGPRLVVPEEVSLQASLSYAIEQTQGRLFTRSWHLRVFDAPVLLTSDAPVAMRLPGPAGTPVPGVATADAIYWPLSRTHLLSFENSRRTRDRVTTDAPHGRARQANGLVASQAERWIFHHPDDSPLDDSRLTPHAPWVTETVAVRSSSEEVRVTKRIIRRQS